MASNSRIKGITIEIGGDTTKLDKALGEVNSKTRQLQSELKGVNSLLKMDPKNVTLLKQKQDLLNESIANTKEKLNTLKTAQIQVQEQFDKGEITEELYRDFQREIVATETKLKSLTNELKNFGSVGSQKIAAVGESMKETGSNIQSAGKRMLGTTAAVTGLETAIVAVGSNFDSAMKQVAATMGITVDEIQNGSKSYKILEEAAKTCGESTKYSASEAAEALNYLALAGYDAEQSAETLPKVLNLAAAGNLDLATASDMVTDAMAALGMETKDLDKYIDQMAKTSQKSNTSVAQLGEATLTCAGTVKMSGMSLETMNAELGILANNGIKGAEGGTHLRNIILSLTSPTDSAAAALKQLGINVLDSHGNIRDMNDIMTDFNTKLDGLSDGKKTEIISTIFNKTDISAVNALIKGSGDEFANLKEQLSNSNGAAQSMADTMNSSLSGQLTLLKSQVEGIAIKLSSILIPIITKIISKVSELLTWFSGLSSGTQKIILVIASIVAAIGPVLIFIGKLAWSIGNIMTYGPKIISAISGVTKIIKVAKTAFAAFNAVLLANPIVLIIAAIAALVAAFVLLWNKCEGFRNFWKNLWENVKNICKSVVDGIKGFFTGIIDFVKNNWQGLLLFIVNPFAGAFKLLYDNCEGFRNFVDNTIQKIKEIFSSIASFIINNVIEPIKKFLSPIVNWFINLFTSIYNSLASIISVIWGVIQGLWEMIVVLFTTAVNWIQENVIIPIQTFFSTAIESIKTAFQMAWEFIKNIFITIATWIQENILTPIMTLFSTVWLWIQENVIIPLQTAFTSAWDTLKNGAISAWEGIKNVFSSVATFFGDIFSAAWQKVRDVFSTGGQIFEGIKDSIASVFTTVVNKIIGGINTVVAVPFNAVNKALNKIRNIEFLGISPFKNKWGENPLKVPKIPMLRTGGSIVGEGDAIMAEAGSPEMITMMNGKAIVRPLTNTDRTKALNNNSNENWTVNINNNSRYVDPIDNERQFRNMLIRHKLKKG